MTNETLVSLSPEQWRWVIGSLQHLGNGDLSPAEQSVVDTLRSQGLFEFPTTPHRSSDNSYLVVQLDDAQRSLLGALRTIDAYDDPSLVRLKLACLTALDALGKAAQIAEGTE